MWGPSIVGYGSYHYEYASGHSGDSCLVGFSPRKGELSVYLMAVGEEGEKLFASLGRHRRGKACLYIRRLADVDLDVLDVMGLARKPWFTPETTKLKDQLNAFLKKRNHFALVVDEYGGLQGVVSLEDILEEIVGEIDDEHDATVEGVKVQPDGWVETAGTVTVRDLNRALDWDLPDDQAVTIAGLLIQEVEKIPEEGETFAVFNHRFEVARRRRNQITELRISPRMDADGGWIESG